MVSALSDMASRRGDSVMSSLLRSLAGRAAEPWFDMLFRWTTTGELYDPHGEFVIAEDASVGDESLWHGRYVLVEDRVPLGVVSMELARACLAVGKGINFIRRCLGDRGWELEPGLGPVDNNDDGDNDNDDGNREGPKIGDDSHSAVLKLKERLGYRYDSGQAGSSSSSSSSPWSFHPAPASPLSRTVSRSASAVHAYILSSLFGRHRLLEHLSALRQFLLLWRGDFASALMEGLRNELDSRPPGAERRRLGIGEWDGGLDGVYAYTLAGAVDGAVRATNARFLPEYVLGRLRVELRGPEDGGDSFNAWGGRVGPRFGAGDDHDEDEEDSPESSGTGGGAKWDAWDAFTLTYVIDTPLKAVLHDSAMSKYVRVFRALFRLRRVERALEDAWGGLRQANQALRALSNVYGEGEVAEGREKAAAFLRYASAARGRIAHFTLNLLNHLMFEVLEGEWKELTARLGTARTLDEVVSAHDVYIDAVASQCLLGAGGRGTKTAMASVGALLHRALAVAHEFCIHLGRVIEKALRSADAAADKRRTAERRAEGGGWGHDKPDGDVDGTNLLRILSDREAAVELRRVSGEFDSSLMDLLAALDVQLDDAATTKSAGIGGQTALGAESITPMIGSSLTQHQSASGGLSDSGGDTSELVDHESLRFLTFRLDFNEFYERLAREAMRGGGTAAVAK